MSTPILADLIALGEGFTTEFKQSLPSDLGREICAFANATGGVILIGVDDTGTVVGVQDHNRLKSRVQSIARSADPPVAVEVESEGEVLRVTVPEQHGKPYSFRDCFFIREGATCQQLSRGQDTRLLLPGGSYPAGRNSLQCLRPVCGNHFRLLVRVRPAYRY